jgi:cell division transport system ATP-binding protein
LLHFDLVNIPIGSQIKKSYSLSFKLKKASTLLLETKNLSISYKVVNLSSLRNFQYNGKIILFEKDIKLLTNQEIINYRKNISIAGNDDTLFNNMSIINNIALPLRLRNFSEKIIEKRIEELVLWLDLKDIIYRDIEKLNENELSLLKIVRAIITNPKILILINPLSLNSKLNETILKIITGLMSYRTSILILENFNYNYHDIIKDLEIIKLNSVV